MRKYEQDDYRHEVECILDKARTLLAEADRINKMPYPMGGRGLRSGRVGYWMSRHHAEQMLDAAMAAFEEAGDLIVKAEGLAHE
jgi:hypothetical protein